MYHYGDDCGEQDEHEAEDQWEEQDDGYQEEYAYEAYPTEAEEQDPEYDREDQEDDHEQNQGETLEEDDQDTYEWRSGMEQFPPMDIYLSESTINSDEEEILDMENIKPGGKSICHASVQLVS